MKMNLDLTFKARGLLKYLLAAGLLAFGVSAQAQQNWAQLSFTPEFSSAVPLPSLRAAEPCAYLPWALELPDSTAYDAQTIACLDSLQGIADYSSPALAFPAGQQLTAEETGALRKYLLSSFAVNGALHSGADVSQYREYIQTLNSAVRKRPVYRNVTFRGSKYPPVPLAELRPGAVYADPAFISTSRSYHTANVFGTRAGYLYVILSKTGRQVYYDKAFPLESDYEKEILFPTGTKLRVIAVSDRPNGGKTVYLEEIL